MAGIGLFAAAASASPTIVPIITSSDNVPGTGTGFSFANQIVVGDGGSVALIAADTNDIESILYKASASLSDPLNSMDRIGAGSVATGEFDNLAVSGNDLGGTRLTFAYSDGGSNEGVFQQDVGFGPQSIAFGNNLPSGAPNIVPLQVNAHGQVIFTDTDGSGHQQVLVGNGALGTSVLYNPGSGTPTVTSVGNRLGIFANGSGAAVLTGTSNTDVYAVGGGSASGINSTFHTPSTVANLLGVATVPSGNGYLFLSSSSNSGPFQFVFHDNSGSGNSPKDYTLGASFTSGLSGAGPYGEMTPNGLAALYIPNSSGGSLNYYVASSHALTQIVSMAGSPTAVDSAHNVYTINGLSDLLSAPMINDNGLIIFDATISGVGPAASHQAILEWYQGLSAPIVLLQATDSSGVGGDLIDGKAARFFSFNTFSTESDVYKDALSNDYLGFQAIYSDGSSGVFLLQLPEPGSIILLPLAGFALMMRRRRSHLTLV